MSPNYYVYCHINPHKNEVFYVGKGIGKRSESITGRSKYWKRIISKYGFDSLIIEDNLTNEDSLLKEIYWINRIGRIKNGGTLINMTNGGDGGDTISQHPNRDEILLKISTASKGSNNPNYKGKHITEEWRTKQSYSNSKKHLKVTDTFTGDILYFINSKECAKALDAKPSNIRTCKNKYKLKRRYIIEDNNT